MGFRGSLGISMLPRRERERGRGNFDRFKKVELMFERESMLWKGDTAKSVTDVSVSLNTKRACLEVAERKGRKV